MKRSQVNSILRESHAFFVKRGFVLPPFASWTMNDWKTKANGARGIIECQMGWDITDFGRGDFLRFGLVLFTIRNGRPENLRDMRGKVYAEKVMIAGVDQVTPLHFHWSKTEDIINRGGGEIMIRLYGSTEDNSLSTEGVVVQVDSVERFVEAGGEVRLGPGESITLVPRLYHSFWGIREPVLVGEVSVVNDDHTDNRFLESVGRFPDIEEDEEPLHLLVFDYSTFLA